MAELLITLSDGRQSRHKLGADQAFMGRDTNCEIPLDDPSTSRRHARFAPGPRGYIVEDLGSKNGTLVNDAPCVEPHALKDGDRIVLGSTLVLFCENLSQGGASVVVADNLTQSHATRYVSREKELTLSRQRLQMLYDLGGRLTTLRSEEALLEDAVDICFEMLQFERGAVGVLQRHGRGIDWPIVRNLRGAEGELTISRTLLNRALEHGERAIFTDSGGANADPTVSMVQHGIRSAMCVPLSNNKEVMGVLYGDQTSSSKSYSDEDIDFFAAIAQQVSIGLINCRLAEDQEQMIRLNRDIDLARTIQNGLLPTTLPQRDDLRIAAVNDPGARISGDYYDVIERDDGRVWFLIADVTGEGIPAALIMANLQAVVRATIGENDDPGTLLSRWNDLVHRNTDSSKFVTCLLALIDAPGHRISIAGAGHCPPVILRPGRAAPEELSLEPTYPLGIVPDAEFATTVIEPGDDPFVLFTYTDGVIEAMNQHGQQYSTQRLLDLLAERTDTNPQPLVKQIRKSVTAFVDGAKQSDDITILAAAIG